MEHQIDQNKKFATLLLTASILIAGLLIGGAIVTQNGMRGRMVNGGTYSQQNIETARNLGAQVPSCGL